MTKMQPLFEEALRWSGEPHEVEVVPANDGLIAAGIVAGITAVAGVGCGIAAAVMHLPADLGFVVSLGVIAAGVAGIAWVSK